MAIYDNGTASLAANGQVTGIGTQWTMPLTLIRVGATLVFKTEPVQIYTISEITSDTSIYVYNPNGETVPAGTGYAILAHDGITVQGLAQDVSETLRYYQSRETEVADAVDAFNNFDADAFQQNVTNVNNQSQQVSADAAQVANDKNAVSAGKDSAAASAESASLSAQQASNSAALVSGALIGTFQDGATIESRSQQIIDLSGSSATSYLWAGTLPKNVPAGSTPENTGGISDSSWIQVSDKKLNDNLSVLLSASTNGTPHEKISKAYSSSNEIVVSCWNIQTFSVVSNRYSRKIRSPKRFFDLSRFINNTCPNLLFMQEVYSGPGAHMSNLVVEPFVSEYSGFTSDNPDYSNLFTGYRFGTSTISTYNLSSGSVIRVTDEGDYVRLATRNIINHPNLGDIAVYNVHGSWFESGARQIYSSIISDYKGLGVEKVVISGDFNHATDENWFSDLLSDGFSIVNNLQYDTRNDGNGSWYVDNVIFKGFVEVATTVTSPDPSLSDHKMLTSVLRGA